MSDQLYRLVDLDFDKVWVPIPDDKMVVPVDDERLTRAEWEATIDYEAATEQAMNEVYGDSGEFGYDSAFDGEESTRRIVDAAVKGETDE